MVVGEVLLTAEEYANLPDDGQPTELVRGRVVPLNMPTPRHGEICARIIELLGKYVREMGLGRLVSNDSGVVTERDPDTVRGADVAFYSYARVPRGPMPEGYLGVVPDLLFEVRSSTDRWRNVLAKVVEYLDAGVGVVCILDPPSGSAHVYVADQPNRVISAGQDFTLPEVLGDFRIPVDQFFD